MYFWAFRMVGMCHALSGSLPYSQILFHGLIRDSEGRKMSKSLGNVIDPIDLIDGVSLEELKNRIAISNLDNREKLISLKNQDKLYPKGIEPVGSDAMRLSLLVQDFKSKIKFIFKNFGSEDFFNIYQNLSFKNYKIIYSILLIQIINKIE